MLNIVSRVIYVVTVVERNGTICLCRNYKITVNQEAESEIYPLPRIGEIMATLGNEKIFSKIDLAASYQQVFLLIMI